MTLFTFLLSAWALALCVSFLFLGLLSFLARLPVVAESGLLCFMAARGRLFIFVAERGLFCFRTTRGRLFVFVFLGSPGHFCAHGSW